MNKIYKIYFERKKGELLCSEEIYKMLIEFCRKNSINIKKIVVRNKRNYGCYIKIKGTRENYETLIDYMITGDIRTSIDIESYTG